MSNILEEIAAKTKQRVEAAKNEKPLEKTAEEALAISTTPENAFLFAKALKKTDMAFICEIKKASPSKGDIVQEFHPLEIAREYALAGVDAISVLTEPYWFKGSRAYIRQIRAAFDIPILQKDFIVDEYQIYDAKIIGASAVLLICALLDGNKLQKFRELAASLGLSALVEAHSEDEINMALEAGAEIIGVNNRDLKTFNVDISTSIRLRRLVPENILYVSESGISAPQDINRLRENNVNAVLIGETLMLADDKKAALDKLKGKK